MLSVVWIQLLSDDDMNRFVYDGDTRGGGGGVGQGEVHLEWHSSGT